MNDLKHGEGLITYGDGRTASLQWSEGNVVKQGTRRRKSSVGSQPQSSHRTGSSQRGRRIHL